MSRSVSALVAVCLFVWSLPAHSFAEDDGPRSLDPRLKIELFAEAPQIVTPTGIDVDAEGRVWAIESNTHFPPEGYAGHPTDRVLAMIPSRDHGKAEQIVVFKDGLVHTMSIAVKPIWLDLAVNDQDAVHSGIVGTPQSKPSSADGRKSLEVYIATRRDIFLCIDRDGDLKCDETKLIVHLETTGNYPHNGLAGFAFDAFGNMFFGFGENLGVDYKLIGSDQITLSGGGEGGNIYRCRPDGTKLERWATGFWNPHANCVDASGRLFSLDNDPDSRPPCRLLHIVQDGDYGYRFRNGRKGTHPFTSWNGEIPGTLPMVSGTGEAPSGIVSYDSVGFPEDYRGTLLVGSWGDHRIDKFVLKPKGLSFESIPQPVITGGVNFRPVGLAIAPDGSLYFTDWVLKEYKLHGQGRIWRVSSKTPSSTASDANSFADSSVPKLVSLLESPVLTTRRMAAKLLASSNAGRAALDRIRKQIDPKSPAGFEVARSGVPYVEPAFYLDLTKIDLRDPFVLTKVKNHAADLMVRTINRVVRPSSTEDSLQQIVVELAKLDPSVVERLPHESEYCQLAVLLALRKTFPKEPTFVRMGLRSTLPSSRRLAVQWVGEESLGQLRPEVEHVLSSEPMTTELFLACLASLSMIDGITPKEFEKTPPSQYMIGIVESPTRGAALRATALRMLPPSHEKLNAELLGSLLKSNDDALRREAVRTLQHSPIAEREQLLLPIAMNESLDPQLRADAIAGLASVNHQSTLGDDARNLLLKLAASDKSLAIRLESIRSLRGGHTSPGTQADRDSPRQDGLKAMAAAIESQPASMRSRLNEALAFATGTQKDVTVQDLLASYERPAANTREPISFELDHEAIEAGRRQFFHVNGAGCYKCHRVGGRGGQVGPDLTVIARTMDRKKLAESVLEPSREISPQFTTWVIELKNGKTVTGLLLGEEVNGDLRLGNQQGEVFFVPFNEIETRSPTKTSIMPEKLHTQMTRSEFDELITFLSSLK